jgi:hypothetical protein
LTANRYIIKTYTGVKILSIDELKSKQFSLKLLLEADDFSPKYSDSLQLQITSTDIVIATTQNEPIGYSKFKRSVKMIKLKVP